MNIDPKALFGALLLALTGCTSEVAGPEATTTTTTEPPAVIKSTSERAGKIIRVVDGDTLQVQTTAGKESVRLIGVDTPETVHPSKPDECFGKEASDYTKGVLPKETQVKLLLDVQEKDRYGRTLAYVYRASDNLFINAELLAHGYGKALAIKPDVAHSVEFSALEAEAREKRAGLWASCPK